jgi:CRISPR-associated protein Cmr6
MPNIPDAAKKVPLMFQAQTAGRCQLQRLVKDVPQQDAERWASQWIEKAYPDAPDFGEGVQSRNYTLSWRFLTNGGQDDGVSRPVIGARGWPFYPGSSMKGIFRRACTPEQAERYCGKVSTPQPPLLSYALVTSFLTILKALFNKAFKIHDCHHP